VSRTQHCNSEDPQGATGCGDLRAQSLSLSSAAKIGPVVNLRVSVLKEFAKRYFPTSGRWIILSQALERYLLQYHFRQHPKIG
jgi:hypothetical protein